MSSDRTASFSVCQDAKAWLTSMMTLSFRQRRLQPRIIGSFDARGNHLSAFRDAEPGSAFLEALNFPRNEQANSEKEKTYD